MPPRLSAAYRLPQGVSGPLYQREGRGSGILHIGPGAFHRAHQAVYTDAAIADAGGDWMITGVSLRSAEAADALNPQQGLFTLLTRGPEGTQARIVGAIARVLVARQEPGTVLERLAAPSTHIVSLTITEKGYGMDPAGGGLDPQHPAIAHDLRNPGRPESAVGYLVAALRLRRERGIPPFTTVCCDNLPDNGRLLERLVAQFAERTDPGLLSWLRKRAAFPSTMVDRITPASSERTLRDAVAAIGAEDRAAVETEPFSQWVIEDRFAGPRPRWEAAGALFVCDVAPYETMKLRMLNGTHSMIAYSGHVAGRRFVRDVMADPDHARLVARHLKAAAATLDPLPEIDLDGYAGALKIRLANPAIAHETYQIAMDGTQKLPQRIFAAAEVALARRQSLDAFAFATAAWMRYCLGHDDSGRRFALRDPREAEIAARLATGSGEPAFVADALLRLPGLVPERLRENAGWKAAVRRRLALMLEKGMVAAIAAEARHAEDG